MSKNDDFTGIFDHLSPDDFNLETSAVDENPGVYRGPHAFSTFVDQQLRAVRLAFAAADGEINPVAVLVSPTVERVFAPDDDETLGQYLDRLSNEARTVGATWFFISKKTVAGVFSSNEHPDVNSPEAMQAAIDEGTAKLNVLWYAERREGDERHHRHGLLEIVGNKLGQMYEGPAEQGLTAFERVLGAVKPSN